MNVCDEEYLCSECAGSLVFVKIIGRYAIYRCVHCDGLERKLVEEQKDIKEQGDALSTMQQQ